MGTTESTLNHGEEGGDKVRPSISPSKHSIQTSGHATPRSVGTVSTASSRNNLHIPRAIQTNGTVSPNIKPSRKRIQSPMSTNSISIGSTTSPIASAKQMAKRQLSIFKGIVCGHEGSGKSSLMYRLRGEEHIPQNKHNNKKKVMALIPWSANSAFSDPDANAGTEKVDAISNGNMKNEVVQLHIVERHEKDYSTWVTRSKVDFVIILVDRTNQESLDAAVAIFKSIETYFANDEKEKSNDNMLSICILLNHYDKSIISKNAKNETTTENKKINLITLEDVKSAMGRQTLDKIQVKYLETCMKIGYGLEALNSFISLPYLQKKREELMKQLEQVNHGLNTWETNFSKHCFVTYKEIHEAQISSAVDTSSAVDENKKVVRDQNDAVEETSDSLVNEASKPNDKDKNSISNQIKTTHIERRSIIHGNGSKSLSNVDKSEKIKPSKKLEPSAKIASKKQTKRKSGKSISKKFDKKVSKKETPVYNDPKEALEAFLASDDDDDDIQYSKTTQNEMRTIFSAKTKHHATNSAVLDSDSDDSSVSSSYYIQNYKPTLSKARDKCNDTTSDHEYESHVTQNDEEEIKEVQETMSSKDEVIRDMKDFEKSQDLSISSTESTPNVNENSTSVRKNFNDKEIQETVVEDESSIKENSDDNSAETEERQKCDVEYEESIAENATTESNLTTKEKKDYGEKCSVHKEIPSEIEVEKIPDLDDNTAQIESSRSDDEVGGQEVIQRDIAFEGDQKQDSTKETQIQSTDVITSVANDAVQVSRLDEEPVQALQNCKCDKVDETSTSIDSLRSKIDRNELDEDEDTPLDLDTVAQEEILPPDDVDERAEASIVEGDNYASTVQIEINHGDSSIEEKSENEEVSKDKDQQDQHSMLSEEKTARASKFTNEEALVFDEESDAEDALLQKNIQVIDSDSDDHFFVGPKEVQAHSRNRIHRSDLKDMRNVEAHKESVQENHSTEVSLSADVNGAIQAALAAAQKNAEKVSKPKKSKKSKKSSSSNAVEKKKKKKKKKSVVAD